MILALRPTPAQTHVVLRWIRNETEQLTGRAADARQTQTLTGRQSADVSGGDGGDGVGDAGDRPVIGNPKDAVARQELAG
jgi:hypothetical protein